MQTFEGKTVLIAGGATGIGARAAEMVCELGGTVVIGDVNIDGAKSTARRITDAGGHAIAIAFDLADDAAVDNLVASTVEQFGAIDGLFNVGADLTPQTLLQDFDLLRTDLGVWRRTFDVNLLGYVRTSRAVLPHMLAAGRGAMVHTSSGAAFNGLNNRVAYSASKAAVEALSRHISTCWGPQGIRSNAIEPGMVIGETQERMNHHELHAEILTRMRSPRLGIPSDIAAVATFLLSDDGEWVNGQTWNVDGGLSLRG